MVNGGGKTFPVFLLQSQKITNLPHLVYLIFLVVSNIPIVLTLPRHLLLFINPDISSEHLIRQWFEQFYFRETLRLKI